MAFAVELSVFNVLAYPVEHWKWEDLVENQSKGASSGVQELEKSFYLSHPVSTMLQLDLSLLRVRAARRATETPSSSILLIINYINYSTLI